MKTFVLRGRTFAPVGETTLEHDEYIMGLRREAGLDVIVLAEGETPEDAANRVFTDVIESGRGRKLLAALVVPVEGESPAEWSEAVTAEVYAFLGTVKDPVEKALVHRLTLQVLRDFLNAAPPRSMSTASSSTSAGSGSTVQ